MTQQDVNMHTDFGSIYYTYYMKRLLVISLSFLLMPLIGMGIVAFFYKDSASLFIDLLSKSKDERQQCYNDPNCWQNIERFCEKESSFAQMICSLSERLKSMSTVTEDILPNQTTTQTTTEITQGTLTTAVFDSEEEARQQRRPYVANSNINKDITFVMGTYYPKVKWVKPGSTWNKAGFKAGDRIFRINNKSQSSRSAMTHLKQLYLKKGPHSVWIKRDQQEQHLIFSF